MTVFYLNTSCKIVMYSNATGFCSTPTKNLTFTPTTQHAPKEHFGKIIDGKVRIRIYDFSNGKGGNAVETVARIDKGILPCLQYLAKQSIYSNNDFFYPGKNQYESKIFGEPMESGSYAGLCQMTKINFSFSSSKNSWGISISNGFAEKKQTKTGGFAAASGSYREEKKSFFSVSAPKFLEMIEDTMDYFQLKKIQVAINEGYLPKWETEEKKERQSYRDAAYNTGKRTGKDDFAQSRPQTKEGQPATQKTASKNYTVVITSDFKQNQKGLYCECTQDGRAFLLYFKKMPVQPLKKGCEISIPISVIQGIAFYAE